MLDLSDHIGTGQRNASFRTSAVAPVSWRLTATAVQQSAANFYAVIPTMIFRQLADLGLSRAPSN
jgi:hypothetical protein